METEQQVTSPHILRIRYALYFLLYIYNWKTGSRTLFLCFCPLSVLEVLCFRVVRSAVRLSNREFLKMLFHKSFGEFHLVYNFIIYLFIYLFIMRVVPVVHNIQLQRKTNSRPSKYRYDIPSHTIPLPGLFFTSGTIDIRNV